MHPAYNQETEVQRAIGAEALDDARRSSHSADKGVEGILRDKTRPSRVPPLGQEDTGPGIALETLSHLFKKFSRADAHKANLLGSGLGLYLSKTLTEAQGGRVWAESAGKGQGSTFWIELPGGSQPT